MNNFDDLLKDINWKELAEQKKSLKIVVGTLSDNNYEVLNKHMPKLKFQKKETHITNLNKLLTLIDKIQTIAIEQGVKINDVYPIAEKITLVIGANKFKN